MTDINECNFCIWMDLRQSEEKDIHLMPNTISNDGSWVVMRGNDEIHWFDELPEVCICGHRPKPEDCLHKNTQARGSGFTVFANEEEWPLGIQEHLWIPNALVTCLDCGAHFTSDRAKEIMAEAERRLLAKPPEGFWERLKGMFS